MTDKSTKPGRLTLPIERGIDAEVRALVERLGADAGRNSDGTELPEWVDRAFAKVYSTYFPARGDEEWADHMSRPAMIMAMETFRPGKTNFAIA